MADSAPTRVVILGGGFGGAYLAQSLQKRARTGELEVVIIDRNNFFVFYPLLVEAGTGSIEPRHCTVPIRDFARKSELLMAEVKGLDVDAKAVRYGRDGHYDVISAFIKSIRGSDADAAVYWLARMLEAGEDPRFIARRLVIHASEDIGLADPQALLIATAAAQAVEFVGLPEAQLNLAHAAIHLATSPKSNRVTRAIFAARAAAREAGTGEVPPHLRDGHYKGAESLGHGVGYRYPHDEASGWADQQYLPDELVGRIFYEPSDHGREGRLRQWWPGHQRSQSADDV